MAIARQIRQQAEFKLFLDNRGKGLGVTLGKTTGCSGMAYVEFVDEA